MHEATIAAPRRPFLSARWNELVMLNFAVPSEVIARLAPNGTTPDLFDGKSFITVVGFWFRDTRVMGLSVPGHTTFQEVNLRFYVRRVAEGELRRGVVFVEEIVPRRAIAVVANWLYHESYVVRAMASETHIGGAELSRGDQIEYRWQTGRAKRRRWNRLGGRVADNLRLPAPGSFEEFIVEHYWGYSLGGPRGTYEYRVEHAPWKVAPLDEIVWDCDIAANYGATSLGEFLAAAPTSAFVADGSAIHVLSGRRISIHD